MPHRRIVPLSVFATALLVAPLTVGIAPAQAVSGNPATDNATYAFTARIEFGDSDADRRVCSGTLIDAEWVLTTATCLADSTAADGALSAGAPKRKATAVIGRTDRTSSQGAERRIVELVPRTDRDVVLARLSRPVTNVTPVALAGSPAASGEELTFAGYGRTKTEWVPLKLHTGTYTVNEASTTTATVTGKDGMAACAGDSGGPVVRGSGATAALVGLTSRSWQGGCFASDAAETRTDAVVERVDDLASWVEAKVGAARITDFNGDGVEDIAISDPKATVNGQDGAGVVRIVYGGGKAPAQIDQELDWVAGGSEANDWFGEALATVDYNEDGYTDLVVGTPSEDLGGATDVGMVEVLYGAAGGLGTGPLKATHFEQGTGSGAIASSGSEAGDRMGDSLAAGTTAAGEPYLIIGVPGESLGSIQKAGGLFYLRGSLNLAINQDSTGVPGGPETNDLFGTAVAANSSHFAVGVPNEMIGSLANSGALAVFKHGTGNTAPSIVFGVDQDADTVSGGAEANDKFGASLAMVDYRPSASSTTTETILAVGSPGESMAVNGVDKPNTGRVVTFQITAAGAYKELNSIWQGDDVDDVVGGAEPDDRFGDQVTAVNIAPRATGTPATLRVAVGVPGEGIGAATNAGAIQTFPLLGAPGASDVWIQANNTTGLPGTPGVNQYVGFSINFTGTSLQVGMPYGPSLGAVHVLPWSNVSGGTNAPITTYQPGSNGLPSVGGRFGYVTR